MFDASSRYASLATKTYRGSVQYVDRRIVPALGDATTFVRYVVTQGDRLDTISARFLGDPTQYWRVCDSNAVMTPTELVSRPGRIVRIAGPQQ